MGGPPRNPRRRPKVPGTFRTHERKGPDLGDEARRVVLYLPAATLERAEAQASRDGAASVQRYCEALLGRAIESDHAEGAKRDAELRGVAIRDLLEIADDPEYLADWHAGQARPIPAGDESPEPTTPAPVAIGPVVAGLPAAEVVARHAGLRGDDPSGFLASLRRGEAIDPGHGLELLHALAELEEAHRGGGSLGRELAFALHKLGFEGQVLVSEAWPAGTIDEGAVALLRRVQEGADRVLSGRDIRYFPTGP